jgi:hypothetical protein
VGLQVARCESYIQLLISLRFFRFEEFKIGITGFRELRGLTMSRGVESPENQILPRTHSEGEYAIPLRNTQKSSQLYFETLTKSITLRFRLARSRGDDLVKTQAQFDR